MFDVIARLCSLDQKDMSRWRRYQGSVKVLLVVVVFLISVPTQPAVADPAKIPTAFSEDGRLVLIQMNDLVLWDLEAKVLLAKVPGLHCQQIVLLKQDGWLLCVGNSVIVYDWKNQTAVATIPPESRQGFNLLAHSQESNRIVLRHGHEAVSVWQIGKKLSPLKHIALDVKQEALSVAASPDTKTLAIAQGHTIHFHDLTGTSVRDLVLEEGMPRDLLFAPNSSLLAASIGNTIALIDTVEASIHARATLTNAEEEQSRMTPRIFSKDGSRLVAGDGERRYPVFEVETGKLIAVTEFTYVDQKGGRTHAQLAAVDISADADYLVGQPEHLDRLQMWDVRTGTVLPDLCGEDCRTMASHVSLLKWSPTGSKIVVAMQGGRHPDVDGKVSVWDVPSRSPELVLDPDKPQAKVLAKRTTPPAPVAMAPSTPTGEPTFVHAIALRALAVSPTANLLVTSGDDGLLKVWDPGQGTLLRQLALSAPASALAFSADGAILAVGTTQGNIRLWETQSWREFLPYASRQGQINALQFLPGNRFLVVAGRQPKVSIVDVMTRMVVNELVHPSFYTSCNPNGCVKKRASRGEVVETLNLLDGSPLLVTTSGTGRVVWDITTWKAVEKPAGLPEAWVSLGWRRPFVSTMIRLKDPNAFTLAVWDPRRNTVLASLDMFTNRDIEIHEKGATQVLGASIAVDPLHRWAATRVGEHVSVWDLSSHAKRKAFHIKTPSQLHWTSDGKYLIVATLDRKILVWSAETMEPLHYLRDPSLTR
jgi:WD40 repeat protein